WKQKKAVEIKKKSLPKKPTSPAKQTVEASRQKKAIEIKDKSLQKKATSPTKQTVEALFYRIEAPNRNAVDSGRICLCSTKM
ncbi:hypothetical protein Tco_0186684, partial [Tanacetum coccineum]